MPEKKKEIFWCTVSKNSLVCKNIPVFTYTKLFGYTYTIHVDTTDSVRPQQWPPALNNKLQVFYENL